MTVISITTTIVHIDHLLLLHTELHRSLLDGASANVELFMKAHLNAALVGGELVVAELPGVGIIGAATW